MGYESSLSYIFSEDAEIKNVKELNEKISELDSCISNAIVTREKKYPSDEYYSIEIDDCYSKLYDNKDFADIISKYLVKGSIDLIWTGEDDNIEAIRVLPNKTIDLVNIFIPQYMIDDVKKYVKNFEKTKNKK